ncbi:MAG: peptidoglycan-binding protein [Actinomycetota bacterium]
MPVLSRGTSSDDADRHLEGQLAPTASAVAVGSSNDEHPPSSDRKLPWRWMLLAIGVLIAVVAAVVFSGRSTDDTDEAEAEPLRAVEAVQQDLIEFTDLDGTMRYALIQPVTAGTDGTVTEVVADGDTIVRGDTLYAIDGLPAVVFYGEVPLYRSLTDGSEGPDVEILEANLASLGYNHTEDDDGEEIDTGFTVDGVFDGATADAVIRWQEDLGVDETGSIDPALIVVVEGPAIVSNLAVDIGSRAQNGSSLLELNVVSTVSAFYASHTGEITVEAPSGPVGSGDVIYVVDEQPITAIVAPDDVETLSFDRDLSEGVEAGDDVLALEEMLSALGYDAGGDLEVDDEFDNATTEAVQDWQGDLQDRWEDVDDDGIVDSDQIVVVDEGLSLGEVTERDSDNVATGSELFSTTSDRATRIVATAIDVADQDDLVEGQQVDIEFPDGSVVAGTVIDVATSSTVDPANADADPQLSVEIALDSVPASAEPLNELDVEVKLVERIAEAATVVPVSALVATGNGGFAVEVASGNTTSFVAVEPGMFADGFVEVSGIEPGTAVVVPQ